MTSDIHRPSRRAVLAGVSATLLPLPSRAQGTPAENAEPKQVLRATPVRLKLFPEAPEGADIWAFDGQLPGPVIRVRHGKAVSLRLRNETPSPLSLHWHGVRGPNAMDGVAGLTQDPVPPGGQFDYRFVPPDPGTYLVRPIVPGRSGEAAGRGLSALLVVEEREPPRFDAEYALIVRDWRLNAAGAFEPFPDPTNAALAGRLGNRMDAGGRPAPNRIEAPPGSRIRLRLANGANARILRIRFDNLKVYVGAIDGQPTETFEPLRSTLPFAPGSRYDLFIDLPNEGGQTGSVVALLGNGMPLVVFATTSAAPAPEKPALTALPPNPLLPPEIKLQNAVRKEVVISGGATRGPNGEPVFKGDPVAIWTLNGAPGSAASPPLLRAPRGAPVVLGITNKTGFPQPIHLHGHVFRLLHAMDDGWEPYWLDTFQIPEGKTLHIAFIADNPGKWMLASTVLERLDTGLWTWFEVA
jgi:FtsP/CotA-like multicopper oxidase with cupredoxin domain